jgi:O-antigen/teichoic acid export membrane protein
VRGVGRDALTLAAGTVLAQALLIGVAPILTRLYTPAEIGASSVLVGAMGIWALSALQLDWAIPLARGRLATAEVCALAVATGAVLAAVVALAVALFGDALADVANVPEVAGWFWLLPAQVVLGAIGLTATGVLMRRRNFRRLAAVRAAQAATIAVVGVAAGLAGGGGGELAAATTVGLAAYALVATTGALRGEWRTFRRTVRDGFAGLRKTVARWRGFSVWGTASVSANLAREAIVPVLIAALYGPAAAGVVFVAQRVLQAPVTLAGEAVSRAWYGTAAEIVRRESGELRATLERVTRSLVLIGGAVLAVTIAAGPALFPIVFGDDFESGSDALLALAPLHFMMLVAIPAGMTLIALDRRRLQTVFTGARLLGAVATLTIGHAVGVSLTGSLAMYAASMALVSAGLGLTAWRLSGQADAKQLGSAT